MISKSQNDLLTVASLSMELAGKSLPPYSCAKSPHKFTQAQLMTCLILRSYLKTTYRGVIHVLSESDDLRQTLDLKCLPHYSTLKYFGDRGGTSRVAEEVLAEIASQLTGDEPAVASTEAAPEYAEAC